MDSYKYPVKLIDNQEGGYILEFRDLPEINSEIWSIKEFEDTAVDALVTMLDLYFEHNKVFPKPSKPQEGEILISPPLSFIAKMLLLNTMVSDNIGACDLAKKMNIKRQEVNRIIDLRHVTKIDTIQKALQALGKDLELQLN